MKIEGQLNLSLISEALADKAASIESRIMNHAFKDNTDRLLLCAKLRKVRNLHNHINQAALSDVISKSLVIQN